MLSSFFIVCCACWWSAAVSWDYPAPSDSSFLSTYEPQVKPNGTLPSDSSFLSGVLSSLTVTAVSEVGDKTFFIALVLALTHPPAIVYAGALSALAFMTILSASLGLVFSYLSSLWVHYLSALLFLLFGLKMLKDGFSMSSNAAKEELEEVQKTVETKMTLIPFEDPEKVESNHREPSPREKCHHMDQPIHGRAPIHIYMQRWCQDFPDGFPIPTTGNLISPTRGMTCCIEG
ncbi:unnamed protein product [Larinioides sclopetarius]|uniref:GDT1 family protein n=1 Tax=Larinioides sclopetarius TaxID=280406 RepID=A0AAV2B6J6_9ARAC